ncbi:serine/threonine-protein kinase [Vitiosangium sp. GDMCC 1.1324]|uniref:serine/threonine-protein kinase n=1 Tax=Vitiosangium sp. (strain GDMCC 1.1324) TaxID=2138576 RepID=UPI00130ED7AF|nr:serine/threonine-protein kinase [Vitiosangium sp. GDMCC 1.1324]
MHPEHTPRATACPRCKQALAEGAACPCTVIPVVPRPWDSLVGARIGDYVIEERIGVGGMGIVYRAVQPLIGKEVAMKLLQPQLAENPEELQRLLTEARAVNAIQHRGIIDIFGFGVLPDGRQYVVMEYLRGVPLDAWLKKRGRLEVKEVLPILDEICSALGAAHGAGVIHRDLKPSNVFLVEQADGTRYVKLLDFGIAKLVQPYADTPATIAGQMLGTPGYMSPEQARGQPVGPSTDLYALGVLAYKLLTGRTPFSGAEPYQVVLRQCEEDPPPPSFLCADIPPELDTLILRLMSRKPEQRPGSAEEVRQMLAWTRDTTQEPTTLRSLTAPATARLLAAASRVRGVSVRYLPVAGALCLLLVGVLLGGVLREVVHPRPGVPPAIVEAPAASKTEPVQKATPPSQEPLVATREDAVAAAELPAQPSLPASAGARVAPSEEAVPTPSPPKAKTVSEPVVRQESAPRRVASASPSPEREHRKSPEQQLLERIDRLGTTLRQSGAKGQQASVASLFLEKARKDAQAARTAQQWRELNLFLDEWERKFLRK